MKRLCQKLAGELRTVAAELASKVGSLPDDADPRVLEAAELALRDAIANLRSASNRLGKTGTATPTLETMRP